MPIKQIENLKLIPYKSTDNSETWCLPIDGKKPKLTFMYQMWYTYKYKIKSGLEMKRTRRKRKNEMNKRQNCLTEKNNNNNNNHTKIELRFECQ